MTTRIRPFISAGKVFRANYNFKSRRPDLFTTKVKYSSTSHFYHTGSDHEKIFGNNTYNESASNLRSPNTIHSSQYHMCRSLVSITLLAIERTIYTVLSHHYTCRRLDLTISQSCAYDIYSLIAISAKGLTHINSLLLSMRITFTPPLQQHTRRKLDNMLLPVVVVPTILTLHRKVTLVKELT